MQNSITSKPAYVRDLYLNTMNGLFGAKGVLSGYIVGLDINPSIISIENIDNNRVSLRLSIFHTINMPEVGIQKGADYDCFVGPEKRLFLRFRVDDNGKISILRAGAQMVRPTQIDVVESSGDSQNMTPGTLSRLQTRITGIFSRK